MKRLILFLIRRKLGLKMCEAFQFTNQKSDAIYYITGNSVMKLWRGNIEQSHVSINWLLDDDCEIKRYYDNVEEE